MELKEMIAVMQAALDGKTIQYKRHGESYCWATSNNPMWDWTNFEYRVKPTPKIRPMTQFEFTERVVQHNLKLTKDDDFYTPLEIRSNGVCISYKGALVTYTYQQLVNFGFTFDNGEPCYIKEDE